MRIARCDMQSETVDVGNCPPRNLEHTIAPIFKVQALLSEPPGLVEHGRHSAGAIEGIAKDVLDMGTASLEPIEPAENIAD
ncbi:hypothetical protein DL771_001132 [Monosporascus sp. 5C6A]|nr:hypothetical protein DL771_001132 [Monosporascus sp. 5C6A]